MNQVILLNQNLIIFQMLLMSFSMK